MARRASAGQARVIPLPRPMNQTDPCGPFGSLVEVRMRTGAFVRRCRSTAAMPQPAVIGMRAVIRSPGTRPRATFHDSLHLAIAGVADLPFATSEWRA